MTTEQAAPLPLAQLLAAIAGVYVSQSLVTAIAMQAMPALLRAQGVGLQWLGLSSLVMLPWALKFLWAPAIERWRLPLSEPHCRSRQLIVVGQSSLVLLLLALALASPLLGDPLPLLLSVLLLAAGLSASTDVACDGYAIDQLKPHQRGWGNVAQVGGSYLGWLLGGSVFLLIAAKHGWHAALLVMALSIVLLSLPMLSRARPPRARAQPSAHRPGLAHAWRRSEVRIGVLLSVAAGLGIRLASGMLSPLLVDRGVSIAQIGMMLGPTAVLAGLAGTALGGILVRRRGAAWALRMALWLQASVLLSLALVAHSAALPWLLAAIALLLGTMGSVFVASYSLLMTMASPQQPGLDFSLFQCADAALAALAGIGGGMIAGQLGYFSCFALAGALAASTPLLLRLLPLHGDGATASPLSS